MKRNAARIYAKAFLGLLNGKSRNQGEGVITQFVESLGREGKKALLPLVAKEVERLLVQRTAAETAHVTTARPLSEPLQKDMREMLRKEFVHLHVDPRILGGVLIRTNDAIIDGTVTGALARFKKIS